MDSSNEPTNALPVVRAPQRIGAHRRPPEPDEPGGPLLADEYFFLAVEERAGKRRLHPKAVGLGLGAALLAELVFNDCIDIYDGQVFPLQEARKPRTRLGLTTFRHIVEFPQHRELRTWLPFLAVDALANVGQRLEEAGLVTPVQRGLLRRRVNFLPVLNRAATPAVRLTNLLTSRTWPDTYDAGLLALVHATGLTWHLLWNPETAAAGAEHLNQILSRLPAPLHELAQTCEALVGTSVMVAH